MTFALIFMAVVAIVGYWLIARDFARNRQIREARWAQRVGR